MGKGHAYGGHRRRWAQASGGFSLLELVVVLSIMAILAAVAVPRYGKAIQRYRTEMAARRVASDLTFARRRATISSTAQAIDFNASTEQYQMPGVKDMRDASSDYTVRLSGSPYNAEIVSASFNGDGEVVFDGYGVPDSGGTIVVGIGDYTKTIVLSADSGKAEIQ